MITVAIQRGAVSWESCTRINRALVRLCPQIPPDRRLNPSHRGRKPAYNRLSYGTVYFRRYLRVKHCQLFVWRTDIEKWCHDSRAGAVKSPEICLNIAWGKTGDRLSWFHPRVLNVQTYFSRTKASVACCSSEDSYIWQESDKVGGVNLSREDR